MSVEEKLKCNEVARIVSDGLDAEMSPAARARLQLHMAACTACRNVEQQFALLRRLMRKDPPDEPPNTAR